MAKRTILVTRVSGWIIPQKMSLKTKDRYEKSTFLILLIGGLHHPEMFYAIMAFVLPLLLQNNIFPVKDETKFSRVGIL